MTADPDPVPGTTDVAGGTALPARRLGTTGVSVSVLGFGASAIGNLYSAVEDDAARAAVDAAWDAGVRYFDTAPHYGLGLSERRLGAALAGRPRGEFTVSTKVGRLLVDNPAPVGSDLTAGGFAVPDSHTRVRDYSRDGVLRSLEASLSRLGMDRVDVVYVHDCEDHLGQVIDAALPALTALRDEGVVGAVGAGMNVVAPTRRIVAECDVDVVMLAGRYTLLDRSGLPLLEESRDRDVSVVSAAPFNSGLLARPWPPDGAYFDYAPAPPELLRQARGYARICEWYGAALPQAAINFPLRHPAVAGVVAGMRSAGQVRRTVGWATDPVPEGLWAAVDSPKHHPRPSCRLR